MPLHLLGKKSWNVYNPDSIARVRRDEAEARSREAEEERKERDENGETRLAQLRGLDTAEAELAPSSSRDVVSDDRSYARKKRRLPGENDTDREIRLSQISASRAAAAPVTDHRGNIDLIQHKDAHANTSKPRPENDVDGLGMRLADAAGRGSQAGKPWYNTTSPTGQVHAPVGRDVWGNEDPRRIEREKKRMDASDPLALMKKGVKQLRQAEAQRQEWRAQRERDLVEVEQLARRERKLHRRRGEGEDSLNGFDLDAGYSRHDDHDKGGHSHHKHGLLPDSSRRRRHYHRHRHRSRSRSRSPRRT